MLKLLVIFKNCEALTQLIAGLRLLKLNDSSKNWLLIMIIVQLAMISQSESCSFSALKHVVDAAMSAEGQLISISLEDLPSLIAVYKKANNQERYLDPVNNLTNYKRWKESPAAEKFADLDVLTLDNDWTTDGLFFLRVRNANYCLSNKNLSCTFSFLLRSVLIYFPSRSQMIIPDSQSQWNWLPDTVSCRCVLIKDNQLLVH